MALFCYEEAVRSNLVSAVAQQYYYLLLLDRQLDILTQTDSLWNASLETQKALLSKLASVPCGAK